MKSTSVLNGLPPIAWSYFTSDQCRFTTPGTPALGQGTTRAKNSATDGASPIPDAC